MQMTIASCQTVAVHGDIGLAIPMKIEVVDGFTAR
jgi:hypothetical protein